MRHVLGSTDSVRGQLDFSNRKKTRERLKNLPSRGSCSEDISIEAPFLFLEASLRPRSLARAKLPACADLG